MRKYWIPFLMVMGYGLGVLIGLFVKWILER